MALFADNMRAVFWVAIVPAALAVLCVVIGVEDRVAGPEQARTPIRMPDLKRLSRAFWGIVALGVVFTLARFSEAFLILKANAEGLPPMWTPLVLVVMNVVYSIGAFPAGALSDRLPARTVFLWGVVALVAGDLALAFGAGLVGAFTGIALWGAHMALTQGLLAKLVADHAPAELRGSAFGIFNLATGLALLIASVLAGVLWDLIGASATFLAGAGFALLAVLMLFMVRVPRRSA
jgi:MFS family permease